MALGGIVQDSCGRLGLLKLVVDAARKWTKIATVDKPASSTRLYDGNVFPMLCANHGHLGTCPPHFKSECSTRYESQLHASNGPAEHATARGARVGWGCTLSLEASTSLVLVVKQSQPSVCAVSTVFETTTSLLIDELSYTVQLAG